jgi:ParB family transcriptional regulator, chromosome partitioning protein
MSLKKKPSSDAFANIINAARENKPVAKTETSRSSSQQLMLPLEDIQLRVRFKQPRHYFDPHKMAELEHSIRSKGIEDPLIVRPLSNGYELVDGERRYRTAKTIGLEEVPVNVREMDDKEALEYSLTKFLLSEDLNPIEQTQGILDLLSLELACKHEEVVSLLHRMDNEAKGKVSSSKSTHNVVGNSKSMDESRAVVNGLFLAIGISWESFLKHRLPLLDLPDDVLKALQQGQIAYTKAQAIARMKDEKQRGALLQKAIEEELSLSQIKEKIAEVRSQEVVKGKEPTVELKSRIDDAYKLFKRSSIWANPKKQKRLEKLLAELEALASEEP